MEDRLNAPAKETITKKTRRVDQEKLRKVGQWIQTESWEVVFDGGSATGMVNQFLELVHGKLESIRPVEEVKLTKLDGKKTSMALRSLSRQRLREYTKHGNSEKFKDIKRKQKEQIRKEGKKLLDKHLEAATEGKGLKWLQDAKRLATRPGDDTSSTFKLPDHINRNLTAKESAEEIAMYFSKISQEFKPIEEYSLPHNLEEKL